MSAALLTEFPVSAHPEALDLTPKVAPPAALTTIPSWDVRDLVEKLNGVSMSASHEAEDPATALKLYAEDVQRAVPFYRTLASRMVLPHMAQAGQWPRQRGTKAPDNVVLVGAAGGMGAGVALKAARRGARVTLIDIPGAGGEMSAALRELAKQCSELTGAERVQVLPLFATDDAAMAGAMQQAAQFGGGQIDLLFHAAGIFGDKRAFEVTEKHLSFLMDVNVRSTLISIHSALPYLVKSANPSFVFVSSMAAMEFVGNQAEYCFTKHHQRESMNLLGHFLSHHLAVKVTELRFGHVYTPMCHGRGLDGEKMIQVDEVAELVWHIAGAPMPMRFQAVEVTPSERLEGEVVWPQAELARLQSA